MKRFLIFTLLAFTIPIHEERNRSSPGNRFLAEEEEDVFESASLNVHSEGDGDESFARWRESIPHRNSVSDDQEKIGDLIEHPEITDLKKEIEEIKKYNPEYSKYKNRRKSAIKNKKSNGG